MIAQIKRLFRAEIKYMYCMYTWWRPYNYKIGISNAPKFRRAQVEQSLREKIGPMPVKMFPPFPMLFARMFERQIHTINRNAGFSAEWAQGTDGGTEWHFGLNIFSAFFVWYFSRDMGYTATVLASPVVWDAWLLTFAVFFLDIAVFWLGVWAVYSYFF